MKKERTVDKAAIENVMLRTSRPVNKFQCEWEIIISKIKAKGIEVGVL